MINNNTLSLALTELGYNTGWYIVGDSYEGIEWIDEPENIPSKEEVEGKALEVKSILETRAQEERALKVSVYTKLGLTEEEINAIL